MGLVFRFCCYLGRGVLGWWDFRRRGFGLLRCGCCLGVGGLVWWFLGNCFCVWRRCSFLLDIFFWGCRVWVVVLRCFRFCVFGSWRWGLDRRFVGCKCTWWDILKVLEIWFGRRCWGYSYCSLSFWKVVERWGAFWVCWVGGFF